jgi:hypothetical protein
VQLQSNRFIMQKAAFYKPVLCIVFMLFVTVGVQSQTFSKAHAYVAPAYHELPVGAIKPKGWLRHQLQIMRDGTTGHLDEVHLKIKNDNGWLGGRATAGKKHLTGWMAPHRWRTCCRTPRSYGK